MKSLLGEHAYVNAWTNRKAAAHSRAAGHDEKLIPMATNIARKKTEYMETAIRFCKEFINIWLNGMQIYHFFKTFPQRAKKFGYLYGTK